MQVIRLLELRKLLKDVDMSDFRRIKNLTILPYIPHININRLSKIFNVTNTTIHNIKRNYPKEAAEYEDWCKRPPLEPTLALEAAKLVYILKDVRSVAKLMDVSYEVLRDSLPVELVASEDDDVGNSWGTRSDPFAAIDRKQKR